MSSFAPKKYGLQLRGPTAAEGPKKPALGAAAVFGDDDSDDGAPQTGAKGKPMGISGIGVSKQKKQVELQLQKAMAEDPSVFEYDEVYDNMAEAKNQVEDAKREANRVAKAQPKYINALLKATETRKVEHERRIEKMIKKEREAEGDQFADKEAFVTSAYKQKMLEMQKIEEEERRQAAREAAEDVTKQSDMMGFYRNLLTKNVAMGGTEEDEKKRKTQQLEKHNADLAEKERKQAPPPHEDREKERETGRQNDGKIDKGRVPSGDEEKGGSRERREKSHESGSDRERTKEKSRSEGRSEDEGRGKREGERKSEGRSEGEGKGKREVSQKGERREEGKSDGEGRGKREAEKEEEDKRKYARRNDEDAVAAARAKALARRAARKTPGALVQGDD